MQLLCTSLTVFFRLRSDSESRDSDARFSLDSDHVRNCVRSIYSDDKIEDKQVPCTDGPDLESSVELSATHPLCSPASCALRNSSVE